MEDPWLGERRIGSCRRRPGGARSASAPAPPLTKSVILSRQRRGRPALGDRPTDTEREPSRRLHRRPRRAPHELSRSPDENTEALIADGCRQVATYSEVPGGDPASNCTQASSACEVPKMASNLQIGGFSGRAPSFGTPHRPIRRASIATEVPSPRLQLTQKNRRMPRPDRCKVERCHVMIWAPR